MEIAVIGGGMAGLFAARALARKNWRVTLFEPDPAATGMDADEAFESWRRTGVPQIRQPHSIRAYGRTLMKERDPEMLSAILAVGSVEWNFAVPVGQQTDPDDKGDLISILGRRTTYEAAVRDLVERTPGISLVNTYVKDLLFDRNGEQPRVAGLVIDNGKEFRFDHVVDASGRRSATPDWLEKAGLPRPGEVAQEAGLIYYSRYFRLRKGARVPQGSGYRAAPSGSVPFCSYFANRTDRDTFSILTAVASWEPRFKTLKDPAVWNAFAASLPGLDEWVDPAIMEPVTKVLPFGGIYDRCWTFTRDGRPLLPGLYVIGDARVHTCPFYGWGMTLGLTEAHILADNLTGRGDLGEQIAIERKLEEHSQAYYAAAAGEDGARSARWMEMEPSEYRHYAFYISTLQPAAARDKELYFKFIRRTHLIDHPEAIFADRVVCERAKQIMKDVPIYRQTRTEVFANFAAAEKLLGSPERSAVHA